MASNTAMVLFVLAIIYVIMLSMAISSTGKRMLKIFQHQKLNSFMQVFICFYICILIQIILTDALYWLYFAKIVKMVTSENVTVRRAITLIFLPTILMILSYSLLYLQLEKQMKLSRIQSGQTFMRRFKPDKVEKVREIIVFTAVACYIVSQVAVLVCAALNKV